MRGIVKISENFEGILETGLRKSSRQASGEHGFVRSRRSDHEPVSRVFS
jgi:hypothetical protein